MNAPPDILGVDPGKAAAWGLVGGARPEHVTTFGMLDPADPGAHFRDLLSQYGPAGVALEVVTRVHPVRRRGREGISTLHALALYQSGILVGDLRRIATDAGRPPDIFAAEEWRKALVGEAQPSNRDIDIALRRRLGSFPAPMKSNNHERDALGVALFGLLRWRLRSMGRAS